MKSLALFITTLAVGLIVLAFLSPVSSAAVCDRASCRYVTTAKPKTAARDRLVHVDRADCVAVYRAAIGGDFVTDYSVRSHEWVFERGDVVVRFQVPRGVGWVKATTANPTARAKRVRIDWGPCL